MALGPYVLVNGAVVVGDSAVLRDVFPGQAIRFPTEDEGRFVPATRETCWRPIRWTRREE